MFYYLYMYIFYISDHKRRTHSMILKDYQKGRCRRGVVTWGHFCLSVLVDIMKVMHGPFFCSSVFISVCVFNVWPKSTLLPVWPRDAKSLDTPALNDFFLQRLSLCLVNLQYQKHEISPVELLSFHSPHLCALQNVIIIQ